jgi:hypothetical protein
MPYYPPPSGGSLAVQDEGIAQGAATTMNFVGAGVTAGVVGGLATVTISGGSGTFAVTQTEVSLSTTPKRSGNFTITNAGITNLSRMLITLAGEAPTGKGTKADELEMDSITLMPERCTAGSCLVRWSSPTWVKGNYKFNGSFA